MIGGNLSTKHRNLLGGHPLEGTYPCAKTKHCKRHWIQTSNERNRSFVTASFGLLAPPFNHSLILRKLIVCVTELRISTSMFVNSAGAQSCCRNVRIANTPASYRLSASTSTACLKPHSRGQAFDSAILETEFSVESDTALSADLVCIPELIF